MGGSRVLRGCRPRGSLLAQRLPARQACARRPASREGGRDGALEALMECRHLDLEVALDPQARAAHLAQHDRSRQCAHDLRAGPPPRRPRDPRRTGRCPGRRARAPRAAEPGPPARPARPRCRTRPAPWPGRPRTRRGPWPARRRARPSRSAASASAWRSSATSGRPSAMCPRSLSSSDPASEGANGPTSAIAWPSLREPGHGHPLGIRQPPDHAHDRRGIDRAAAALVVERHVPAHHRHAEGQAGVASPSTARVSCQAMCGFSGLPKFRQLVSPSGSAPTQARFSAHSSTASTAPV